MYARAMAAAPSSTAFTVGGIVMAVGDAVVQRHIEGAAKFDQKRIAVCASYNAGVSVVLQPWYALLDRAFPGRLSVRKILLNQVVSSTTITPGFLAYTACVEGALEGHSGAAMLDATRQLLERDGVATAARSFCLWTPVNGFMFAFVPQQLRIGYMSMVAVCWGGYLSWVAHGRTEGAGRDAVEQ